MSAPSRIWQRLPAAQRSAPSSSAASSLLKLPTAVERQRGPEIDAGGCVPASGRRAAAPVRGQLRLLLRPSTDCCCSRLTRAAQPQDAQHHVRVALPRLLHSRQVLCFNQLHLGGQTSEGSSYQVARVQGCVAPSSEPPVLLGCPLPRRPPPRTCSRGRSGTRRRRLRSVWRSASAEQSTPQKRTPPEPCLQQGGDAGQAPPR